MANLSVKEKAECFDKAPPFSLKRDVYGLRDNPPRSLRKQLIWMDRQCLLNRVVIVGITGFLGGDDAGVARLIRELQVILRDLGDDLTVPHQNIAHRPWNRAADIAMDFSKKPETDVHRDLVRDISGNPSYVAIIGHSFGGWSASLLSRELSPRPNYVALIDPVFGPAGDTEKRVNPHADEADNWFQRNAIWVDNADHCAGTVLPSLADVFIFGPLTISIKLCGQVLPHEKAQFGLACGRELDPNIVRNHPRKWERDRNGNEKKIKCRLQGKKRRFIAHTSIDDDEHIWEQVEQKIISDLKALIEIE
jgi:hypothetical protein